MIRVSQARKMSSNNSSVPDHGQPGQGNDNAGQAEESDGFFENGWQQPGNENVWNDPDSVFVMPHELARATIKLEWRHHKPMIGTNGWLVDWISSVTGTTVSLLANKEKDSGVPSSDVHIIGKTTNTARPTLESNDETRFSSRHAPGHSKLHQSDQIEQSDDYRRPLAGRSADVLSQRVQRGHQDHFEHVRRQLDDTS